MIYKWIAKKVFISFSSEECLDRKTSQAEDGSEAILLSKSHLLYINNNLFEISITVEYIQSDANLNSKAIHRKTQLFTKAFL